MVGLHYWEERRADIVRGMETLYAQAVPCLYWTNHVPVLSRTYKPRELKELAVIKRLELAKLEQHRKVAHYLEPMISWRCQRFISKPSKTKQNCVFRQLCSRARPRALGQSRAWAQPRWLPWARALRDDGLIFDGISSDNLRVPDKIDSADDKVSYSKSVEKGNGRDQNDECEEKIIAFTGESLNAKFSSRQKWTSGVHQADIVRRDVFTSNWLWWWIDVWRLSI